MAMDGQAIIAAFEKAGVKANVQENSNQVVATLSFHGYDYPLFVRELTGGNLIQMLTFVPCTVQKEANLDLSRLLHMINKELDMPGFCWDEDSRTVFYRVIIPCLQPGLEEFLVQVYLEATRKVCSMFGTIVQAVAVRAMTLDEMLHKAQELSNEKSKLKT
jgi:hypothetical protein